MNVSIIGTGNMAKGIGSRIVAGGNNLTIYGRDKEKSDKLIEELKKFSKNNATINGKVYGDLIDDEIVIFAVPYNSVPEIIKQYKDQFSGKVIIDITNPIDSQTFKLIPPPDSSGAEEIAKLLPSDTKLVKAFNTTLAGTLIEGQVDNKSIDVFIAGDDAEAKNIVKKLADDGGLRGVDVGPLERAKIIEGMQLIQMSLQDQLNTNWMSSIKILP